MATTSKMAAGSSAEVPLSEAPQFRVDFNEMVAPDLVLLSRDDSKSTVTGKLVTLTEGMAVALIVEDKDEDGQPDNLIADGRVERNTADDWSAKVKWCCRIDERGIRHDP